eukprot:3836977-Pleurochrysis_carterae.AAC.1
MTADIRRARARTNGTVTFNLTRATTMATYCGVRNYTKCEVSSRRHNGDVGAAARGRHCVGA